MSTFESQALAYKADQMPFDTFFDSTTNLGSLPNFLEVPTSNGSLDTTPSDTSSSHNSFFSAQSMVRQSSASDGEPPMMPSPSGCDQRPSPSGRSAHVYSGLQVSPDNYAARMAKSRRRTTPDQLKILEANFAVEPKPDLALRKILAAQLDMTPREIQVWFQNRRAKAKKLSIRPPPMDQSVNVEVEATSPLSPTDVFHDHEQNDGQNSPRRHSLPVQAAPTVPQFPLRYQPVVGSPTSWRYGSLPTTTMSAMSSSLAPAQSLAPVPNLYSGNWSQPTLGSASFGGSWTPSPMLPMTTAVQTSTMPTAEPLGDVSRLMLPLLPRSEAGMSELGPLTGSTEYTDFSFAPTSRRESVASVDSFVTDISEADTVSGSMTPVSVECPIPSSLAFDPVTRRSSCPADFIASFESAEWLAGPNKPVSGQHMSTMRGHYSGQHSSHLSQHYWPPGFDQNGGLGRRHSLAVDPSVSGTEVVDGLLASVLHPSIAEALSARRASVPSLLSPILEHNDSVGVHRRNNIARKVRSQVSMRQPLSRPTSMCEDETFEPSLFDQ